MEKILIIGGFGFLGRHIASELISRSYKVSVCDIRADAPPFDVGINVIGYNFLTASDEESLEVFRDYQSIVFCGGRDDRNMPKGDAYEFFYNANVVSTVKLTRLASVARVQKIVIMGSYFSHFNRILPELQLAQRHPYVRSRVEQENQSIAAASNGLQVVFLEIPYVFGTLDGVIPLWKSLVKYISKTPVVFYTTGGTAFISVRNLAQATAGAIAYAKHGDCIPIAGKNMTWKEMIGLVAKSLNKKKPVVDIAWWIVRPFTIFMKLNFKVKGIQSGLDPYHFILIQSQNTYLDIEYCTSYLKFHPDNMEEVFNETIKACLK